MMIYFQNYKTEIVNQQHFILISMYPRLSESQYQRSGWQTDNSQARKIMGQGYQINRQQSQTYYGDKFPKTMQEEKAQKGSSGWDDLTNLSANLANNTPNKNYQNNPYSQWDQAPVNYGGNNNPLEGLFGGGKQGGQNSQSLWDNISIDQGISFIVNPIFSKPSLKYEFPSPFMRYKIIPYLGERMALDVTSVNHEAKKLKKNNLIIWDYHGGPNQLFFIKKRRDGKYYIINSAKGFTMEVPDGSTKDGVNIYANPRNDTENQFWELKPGRKSGSYEIISFCGKALDCENQSTKNGTRVIQWERNQGKNQLWKIVPA